MEDRLRIRSDSLSLALRVLPEAGPKEASAAAYALLRDLLTEDGWLPAEALAAHPILKDRQEKPCLAMNPGIYFNLSHSGRYIACAVARSPLGIDVQEHRTLPEKVLDRFFSDEERRLVRRAPDPVRAFFDLWVRREAWAKYTGEGIFKSRADRACGALIRQLDAGPGVSLAVCGEGLPACGPSGGALLKKN